MYAEFAHVSQSMIHSSDIGHSSSNNLTHYFRYCNIVCITRPLQKYEEVYGHIFCTDVTIFAAQ